MKKGLSLLAWAILCASGVLQAEEFLGRVVHVNAGNRLEVLRDGKRERIRLYGVVCPPGDAGASARRYMRQLTEARSVYVRPFGPDRQGSVLAQVQFIGGVNLSHELLRSGLAQWDKKQAPKAKRLMRLEQEARANRRGLWASRKSGKGIAVIEVARE